MLIWSVPVSSGYFMYTIVEFTTWPALIAFDCVFTVVELMQQIK